MTTNALTACGGCASSAEIERLPADDIVSLISCRLDELQRAGCDSLDCFILAARVDIPLERAANLLSRGCPPDLALRILL